ncbi:hypothetical protein N5079_13625 [Planotetraspora sp. A-T 1434]|uniref:trypsin-like serine peptidase n=1 Tax=Planotetraspora sp. A-T 1434 TaxID=2979219 RepID=UPI0021C0883F|nr:hypothetical protein [Planotetraspora sp. A-T 1434]MCT9931257.1 hypothetical protein [Planotetraspora sp. A-T 1434]
MKKRLLLPLGGVVATGLLSSALVTPAQASGDVAGTPLASQTAAWQIAAFWYGEHKANLIGATPYDVETKVVAKHVSTGGPSADSKPGVVPAIGDEKKSASKSKNVNLPKTTGKVFFLGSDGEPHWCTATSVQSQYHNLVATAGHCVYDTESNDETLDYWVFIPGYYQGKTPWGIYVGKQAFTHYDYDVYEDGDRDYAFVTVYNGVLPNSGAGEVTAKEYDKYPNDDRLVKPDVKYYETLAEAKAHQGKGEIDAVLDTKHPVAAGTPESKTVQVTKDAYLTAKGVDPKAADVSEDESKQFEIHTTKAPKDVPFLSEDGKKEYYKVEEISEPTETVTPTASPSATPTETPAPAKKYKYYYRTFAANYDLDFKVTRFYVRTFTDVGRLGDNVGGQGLAYNQKIGKPVFVFGYPSGSHPDGNYAYSGATLKWSYGKTFAAKAAAIKGEELVGVKSSFTGEGSIGSSWLLNYSSNRRLGYLNGVTIGISDTDKNNRIDTSISPYFDGELYGVYKAAAHLWSGSIVAKY